MPDDPLDVWRREMDAERYARPPVAEYVPTLEERLAALARVEWIERNDDEQRGATAWSGSR